MCAFFTFLKLPFVRASLQRSDFSFLYLAYFISLVITHARSHKCGEAELIYEWMSLEFDWPTDADREEAIANQTYIPERNLVAGIKVYKRDVYLTIPRWFWTSGHPVTLAKVVNVQGTTKLRPFPSWAAQNQGDCNALQYVQGMEIDPNTGFMYVIDTGRIGQKLNLCPAKIVVYDLNIDSQVLKYEFPADVVSPTSNFLNDIVLDYIGGKVRFAYITDANDARIVVFDVSAHKSFTVKHPSMEIEGKEAEMFTINNKTYNIPVALDGIAMSPDFKYVYYCALAGFKLYQIPTSSLRRGLTEGIRLVGSKISQSDGLAYGSKHLYYGALGLNAVYFWEAEKDMAEQRLGMDKVNIKTETLLVRDDDMMQWPDTFSFDNRGWIWFVSNRLQTFRDSMGLPKEGDAYMRVWRVYVNENGYLHEADKQSLKALLAECIQQFVASILTKLINGLFQNVDTA